jgi:hypothetical protein
MSVLLKFYVQKVMMKISSPQNRKQASKSTEKKNRE